MNDTVKSKILVVQPDEQSVKMLKIITQSLADIEVANTGDMGLSKFKNESFDLVISAVNMPEMDGIELYANMNKLDPSIKERFIFFCTTNETGHLSFIKENDLKLITKPAPLKEVYDSIESIINRIPETEII